MEIFVYGTIALVATWLLAVVALAAISRSVSEMPDPPAIERWENDTMPVALKDVAEGIAQVLGPFGFEQRGGITLRYGPTRASAYLHMAREGPTFAIVQVTALDQTARAWILYFTCDDRCGEIVTSPSHPDPAQMIAPREPGLVLRIPDVAPAEALAFHESVVRALLGKDDGRKPDDVLAYVREQQAARVQQTLTSGWERVGSVVRPSWRTTLALAACVLPPFRFLAKAIVTTRAQRLFDEVGRGSFDGCRHLFEQAAARRSST